MGRSGGGREGDQEDHEKRRPHLAGALQGRELGDGGEEQQVRHGPQQAMPERHDFEDEPRQVGHADDVQNPVGQARRPPGPRPPPEQEKRALVEEHRGAGSPVGKQEGKGRDDRERRQHLEGGAAQARGYLRLARHWTSHRSSPRWAGGKAGAPASARRARCGPGGRPLRRGRGGGPPGPRSARSSVPGPRPPRRPPGPPGHCRASGRPRGPAPPRARARSSAASAPTASSGDRGDRRRARSPGASGCRSLRRAGADAAGRRGNLRAAPSRRSSPPDADTPRSRGRAARAGTCGRARAGTATADPRRPGRRRPAAGKRLPPAPREARRASMDRSRAGRAALRAGRRGPAPSTSPGGSRNGPSGAPAGRPRLPRPARSHRRRRARCAARRPRRRSSPRACPRARGTGRCCPCWSRRSPPPGTSARSRARSW